MISMLDDDGAPIMTWSAGEIAESKALRRTAPVAYDRAMSAAAFAAAIEGDDDASAAEVERADRAADAAWRQLRAASRITATNRGARERQLRCARHPSRTRARRVAIRPKARANPADPDESHRATSSDSDSSEDLTKVPSGAAPDDDVLTVEEAADLLRVGRNVLYEAIGKGAIPHLRVGRLIRLSRTAVMASLTSCGHQLAKKGR